MNNKEYGLYNGKDLIYKITTNECKSFPGALKKALVQLIKLGSRDICALWHEQQNCYYIHLSNKLGRREMVLCLRELDD